MSPLVRTRALTAETAINRDPSSVKPLSDRADALAGRRRPSFSSGQLADILRAKYNRLKDQRTRIATLTADLHNQRIEMTQAKDKHTKWQEQLRDKLSGFREEKKNWQSEAMKLRGDLDEYKVRVFLLDGLTADSPSTT